MSVTQERYPAGDQQELPQESIHFDGNLNVVIVPPSDRTTIQSALKLASQSNKRGYTADVRGALHLSTDMAVIALQGMKTFVEIATRIHADRLEMIDGMYSRYSALRTAVDRSKPPEPLTE